MPHVHSHPPPLSLGISVGTRLLKIFNDLGSQEFNRIKTYNLLMTFTTLILFTSYKYYQLTGQNKPQCREHENLQNDIEKTLLTFYAIHLYKIALSKRRCEKQLLTQKNLKGLLNLNKNTTKTR